MSEEGSGFAWGGYDEYGRLTDEAIAANNQQRIIDRDFQMSDDEAYEHFKHIYTKREFLLLRKRASK